MDLTIETKEFVFSLDHIALGLVCIFMMEKLKTNAKEGIYFLTKNEIEKMISFLENRKTDFSSKEYYISTLDKFRSMHMLMHKNEKARFKFW